MFSHARLSGNPSCRLYYSSLNSNMISPYHKGEIVCLLYRHDEVQLLYMNHSTLELFSCYPSWCYRLGILQAGATDISFVLLDLNGRRRWPACPDIAPLVRTVYSVRITRLIQKNERGVCSGAFPVSYSNTGRGQLQVEPSDSWSYAVGAPMPLSGHCNRIDLGWRVENAVGNLCQFFSLSYH